MEKLAMLKDFADSIVSQFGDNCEIVIHKIAPESLDSSVIYIINGHISHRKVGDGPSHVVLDSLKKSPAKLHNKYGYLTKTSDGTVLKSSTLYIKNTEGLVEYIFSINYDISGLVLTQDIIGSIVGISEDKQEPERITQNVNDLLDDLIEESVKLIGKPAPLMLKQEKIKAIQFLNDAGAFLITKSGDKIANYFGISKYTLYNYIDVNKNN